MINKTTLRQKIKILRQQLSEEIVKTASEVIAKKLISLPLFKTCHTFSAYLPIQNEIDPILCIKKAPVEKKCYLPKVKNDTLVFVQYQLDDELIQNTYGISEPIFSPEKEISPQNLDLVLLPLMSFDQTGHRLGRGAGYYDRTFAFLKKLNRPARPYLLGLAYEFQRIEKLVPDEWDIALDAILTEENFYSCC